MFTYCKLRISVSSNFNVISACSTLSNSFLKSKSESRFEEGCDALFLLLFFVVEVSSLGFLSSLYFCNHVY